VQVLRTVVLVIAFGMAVSACSRCDIPTWNFSSCKDARPAGR
jgi:hypothetical protein